MSTDPGVRFVFLDVEATGLDHDRHEMTEVAWIVRDEQGHEQERQYFPFHTTDGADGEALALTQYEERIAPQTRTPMDEWLPQLLRDADEAVIVGAVPDFDVRHLEKACRKLGLAPTWDHHLLDVETLALPLLAAGPERPRSLAKTCEALGVAFDRDQAHGALYDARLAKAAFDRIWELLAERGRAVQPMITGVDEPGGATSDPPEAPEPAASPSPPDLLEPPRTDPDDRPVVEPEAPSIGVITGSRAEEAPDDRPEEAPEPKPTAPGPVEPAGPEHTDVPFPRKPSVPQLERSTDEDSAEDTLFSKQPRNVGHPQFRDPDVEEG